MFKTNNKTGKSVEGGGSSITGYIILYIILGELKKITKNYQGDRFPGKNTFFNYV
jgi:hypothetical protein